MNDPEKNQKARAEQAAEVRLLDIESCLAEHRRELDRLVREILAAQALVRQLQDRLSKRLELATRATDINRRGVENLETLMRIRTGLLDSDPSENSAGASDVPDSS